jgi:hypothetical protein
MRKLLTGLCALALGASVMAGCTERSDRVGGTDRDRTTSPSASPGLRPSDPAAPSTLPPSTPPPPAARTPSTESK